MFIDFCNPIVSPNPCTIVDTEFRQSITVPDQYYGLADALVWSVIEVYEERHLNIAANLILAYKWYSTQHYLVHHFTERSFFLIQAAKIPKFSTYQPQFEKLSLLL
jgi:hypothetical protein